MLFRGLLVASLISCGVNAAQPKETNDQMDLAVPTIFESAFEENQEKKPASKKDRKVADSDEEVRFKESDLSPDFVKFRDAWLKVQTADQMAQLLDESYANYNKYSPDVQFFLAQIHIVRHMRGIIWRMRPMFEKGTGFLGNKATHVSAVQFVRNVATGLDMAFPTMQMDAAIEYFTTPSKKMSKADQFMSIEKFQAYLVNTYVAALNESVGRMSVIAKANPTAVFKWDNRMFFGKGAFRDDINRVIGFGEAEMHATIGMTYEAQHDALVFAAYNQNAIFDVAADLGTAFGIDAAAPKMGLTGFGLTDEERTRVIMNSVNQSQFLSLRSYNGNEYGDALMDRAYQSKKQSVQRFAYAYRKLQNKPATTIMALNPVLYQNRVQNRLGKGIQDIEAAVMGPKEIRDPISGETVTLNIPKFYSEPPNSLRGLMATGWEKGKIEREIASESGETLKARNYFYGRANAWNNQEWSKYVPSAQGKPAGYMGNAKRVMHYALGSGSIFGPIDLFIR